MGFWLLADLPRRSLEFLKDHFQNDVLVDQDPWSGTEQAEYLLQLLPDKALNDSLRKKWEAAPGRSSTQKWADIDSLAKAGVSKTLDGKALLEAKKDVILEYTYPRLDVEVSKKLNHLLKSPFVVHPKTGRVCVPIDTSCLEDFDPLGIPTVTELLGEIDHWDAEKRETEPGEGLKTLDHDKTRLKPHIEIFEKHIKSLLKMERGEKRQREEEMEF